MLQHWLVDTYLPKTDLDIGARNSISTVARYVGIILSGLWTLAALGIGFEKVALLASALSVGIGFGLQAITQNFVSGLILLAERPVKLGDRVRIGDQVGDIRRISVRATEIQTDDKSTLIVPNSELITKSVQNLTMDGALGRISIAFAVPLSTDVVRLKELLLGIYRSHEAVLEAPAPSMYVDSLSGSVINITSFGHVSSPRQVYSTRSDLLFELLRQTAEQGIALSSATDIHLVRNRADAAPVPPNTPAAPEPAPPCAQAAPGTAVYMMDRASACAVPVSIPPIGRPAGRACGSCATSWRTSVHSAGACSISTWAMPLSHSGVAPSSKAVVPGKTILSVSDSAQCHCTRLAVLPGRASSRCSCCSQALPGRICATFGPSAQ